MAKMKIEGLKPVLKRLQKLPERNRRHAIRPAIRKASTPLKKQARKLCPRGTGTNEQGEARTPLYKSINRTSVKWHQQSDTLYVFVGAEYKKSPHVHLVHDGTQPHETPLTRPARLSNGVILPAGFVIQHPGARPQPFMDQAAQMTQGKVQNILKKSILENIEKQVQKLAKTK